MSRYCTQCLENKQTMEVISCTRYVGNGIGSLFLFLSLWILLFCTHFADAQPGFLSIYCGHKGNYTNSASSITWVPDDDFIHNLGEKTVDEYGNSLRVFPKPHNKSCYELPITPKVPHLVRLAFLQPNSTGSRGFNYSAETLDMLYMEKVVFDEYEIVRSENILLSADSVLHVCLIRTSDCDDPFISLIALRPLKPGMYDTAQPGIMLHKEERYDMGADDWTRYPEDPFDRWWKPFYSSDIGAQTLNISSSISVSVDNTKNFPPSKVMRTAAISNTSGNTSDNTSDNIYFYLGESTSEEALVLLYFAELNSTAKRSFSVGLNNVIRADIDLVGNSMSAIEVPFRYDGTTDAIVNLQSRIEGVSPIINAYEIYSLFKTQLRTFSEDVKALTELNKTLSLNGWISDPCFGLPWEGIICKNVKSAIRIFKIDLSGRQLPGSIPPSFGELRELVLLSLNDNYFNGTMPNLTNLSKLKTLHLQNNSLSGKIPDWLSTLPHLEELSLNNNSFNGMLPNLTKLYRLQILHLQNNYLSGKIPDWISGLHHLRELDISNNNFKGIIPQQLLNKQNLTFKFNGNKHLCRSKQNCRDHVASIALGVAGGFIVTIILVGVFIYKMKLRSSCTQPNPLDYLMVNVANSSKSRAFSLEEMTTATENFSHKIGQGSFGTVFLGKLQDGKQIAVKVLSIFNKHGIDQFSNEVDLLSKINHKKLVSFLGYCICNESRDLMLVYEYLSAGSLCDNLHDPEALKYPRLDWKTRLKIALDAAQGLEYLHVGCTPKIIHRDVKTSNILLDSNLNGKLADFGLSRVTGNGETSQINTTIKGTPGYLDPMYYKTHLLTDKSDVYSFGVVLLELICGRKPIDLKVSADNILLTEWVASYMGEDKDEAKIAEIVDKRLGKHYNMKSIVHVANVAWRCIAGEPSGRPTISEIVEEIREAVAFEEEYYQVPDELSLTSTSSFLTSP